MAQPSFISDIPSASTAPPQVHPSEVPSACTSAWWTTCTDERQSDVRICQTCSLHGRMRVSEQVQLDIDAIVSDPYVLGTHSSEP